MTNENEETIPFTWDVLKAFCNTLTDEQLSKNVYLVQEDDSIKVEYASDLGDDHYNFTEFEESISRSDFDKDYHFDGIYATFDEALENEKWVLVDGKNVYLFSI